MMKLGGYVHCTKTPPKFEFGGHRRHAWAATPKCGGLLSQYAKKINKQMWAWQAWQWATPPHPSVNK